MTRQDELADEMHHLGGTLARLIKHHRALLMVVGGAVACVYLSQAFSPLRLNNDSVRLWQIADNFAQGRGFTGSNFMPAGYPAFFVGLDQIGLATPFGLVLANTLLLGAGLLMVYGTVRRIEPDESAFPAAVVAISLFSYLTVKYAARPQSEILYFTLSAAVLYLSVGVDGGRRRRLAKAAVTVPLILLAVSVRSVGVTLFASAIVAFAVAWTGRPIGRSVPTGVPWRRAQWLVAGSLLVVAAVAAVAAAKFGATAYFDLVDLGDYTREPGGLADHLVQKSVVLFQVLFNVPGRIAPAVPTAVAVAAGVAGLSMIAAGIYAGRRSFGPVDAYVLAYVCLVIIWPYYQPRFWMPVLPFLVLVLLRGLRTLPWAPPVRVLATLWAGGFFAMGAVAFAFSLWLTVAGQAFPERYAEGDLRNVYRAAFDGTCPGSLGAVDQLTYDMLLRLEHRAVPCRR